MRRVASLYLPSLATDRLRRSDARAGRQQPDRGVAAALSPPAPRLEEEDEFSCSCPRGGGWRPGARWAQEHGRGAAMSDRDAEIASLPVHQRPSPRQLGRRSEAADHPFKRTPPDIVRIGTAVPASSALPPLVTAVQDHQRMVIAAADAKALALGLVPGMAVTHARALVPGLDVRDADPQADGAELTRLALFAVRRWTPTAMVEGGDGLLLDLSGVAHLHGGERRMAARILRFCARLGLQARIAVAGTIGAAHALARFGAERIVLCGLHEEPEALAALPVRALRLDQGQQDAARRLGIDSVADLLTMPRGPLAKRFGASLLTRLDQAIGRVAEPIDALIPYVVPEVELRFAEPIGAAEPIARAIAQLTGDLSDLLRRRGLGARAVRLVCDRVDRVEQVVTVGTARGTRDVRHLLRLLTMKIETIDPGFGIDAMRLVAIRAEPMAAAQVAGDLAGDLTPYIGTLVDQIVARLGGAAVFRSTAVESDVPERTVRRIPPLDEPAPWPTLWPRPVRILRRPEPVQGVIAGLPDHPPRRFTWRGQSHAVVRADGPERISGEWWKRTAEAYAVRDYFRVENERGERFWLFRRGDGENPQTGDLSWHMHGLFG
jgi:protein ImuB